jgi:hypothetical protein
LARIIIKGRSGATPGAISLLIASETAGTQVLVRAGSELRHRSS